MDNHHHHLSADGGNNPLIPRGQVIEVLKNLNIREGLFTEDEIRELENGYSVSESSESHHDDIQSSVPSSRSLDHHSPMNNIGNSHFLPAKSHYP
jgi:hypothetical protein